MKNYAKIEKGQDSPIFRSIQACNNFPQSLLKGKPREMCYIIKKHLRNRD